jgi:hypothetical protein
MPARWFITACLALLTIAFASGGASAQLLAKKTLSLAAAKKMAAAAEAEAAKNKWGHVMELNSKIERPGLQNDHYIQQPKRCGSHDKHIDRSDAFGVIA